MHASYMDNFVCCEIETDIKIFKLYVVTRSEVIKVPGTG